MNINGDVDLNPILLRAREGDEQAFSQLLDGYMPLIRKATVAFKRPSLTDDELMCEASVAFYKAVLSFDLSQTEVTFGLYAHICVYRRLGDLVSKVDNRDGKISDVDVAAIPVSSGIESRLASGEMIRTVLSRVRGLLSDFEYEVFILSFEGYTTAQIAERLGKSGKSIDNAKFRLTRRLRAESSLFSDIF